MLSLKGQVQVYDVLLVSHRQEKQLHLKVFKFSHLWYCSIPVLGLKRPHRWSAKARLTHFTLWKFHVRINIPSPAGCLSDLTHHQRDRQSSMMRRKNKTKCSQGVWHMLDHLKPWSKCVLRDTHGSLPCLRGGTFSGMDTQLHNHVFLPLCYLLLSADVL